MNINSTILLPLSSMQFEDASGPGLTERTTRQQPGQWSRRMTLLRLSTTTGTSTSSLSNSTTEKH
eukprot:974853-Rhodomonas_salina.1